MGVNILENRRRMNLFGQPHLETLSGSLVTFGNGEYAPMKSCIASFAPVQEGSGEPSPSNVRNITGWTGLTVYHSGADTSEYEEYPVTWQTVAGTQYNGKIDLVSGELTCDYHFLDATPEGMPSLQYDSGNDELATYFVHRGNNNIPPIIVGEIMSNRFSRNISGIGQIQEYTWGFYFKVPRAELSSLDVAGCRAWFAEHPTVFLEKIATPETYQIDPVTIRTLRGTNNIWSNAGNVSATYWTH